MTDLKTTAYWIDFPRYDDSRGSLVPWELADFPFAVQRVYGVTAEKNCVRGGHAHAQEDEVFVVVRGSVLAEIEDKNGSQQYLLEAPQRGLVVPRGVWHQFQDFSPEAFLLAFSSCAYNPSAENYQTDRALWRKSLGQKQKNPYPKVDKKSSKAKKQPARFR